MVVVMIVLAVGIEPALNAFGEILVVVDRGIFARPQALTHRVLVGLFDTTIKSGIQIGHPSQMHTVGKLMHQNVLGGVGVALVAKKVLLPARAKWVGQTSPHAAGPTVVIVLG